VRARRRDHHPRGPAEPTGAAPAGGADRPRDGGPRSGRSRRKRGSGGGTADPSERPSAGSDRPRAAGRPEPGETAGGAQGTGQAGNGQAGSGRSPARGGRRKDRNRRPKVDALSFWGDAAALPSSEADVRITDDPGAVSRSLGTPPLPGQEIVAPHYFAAVYERAVMTAGALAAAGGLIDTETLAEELGE
jgi:hypothetical protein